MRPPTTRPLRINISTSLLARRVVIDLAALAISVLLVHATLVASGSSGELTTLVGKVANPLSLISAHLPGGARHPALANLMTAAVVLLSASAIVGVIAGYTDEDRRDRLMRHRHG
ncbi:MAG TPA: hypothetical protein VFN57_16135 [Thermomicrobiaceae bacterium]|nr:hypothetical protein [Thermomicrobiaceae bacterium]